MKNNIINKLKRYILIVEDEFINQEILKEIVSSKYEVIIANNGLEALDILNSSTKPISLILLDLNMPVMDGFTVIKNLKKDEQLMNIPIIVITGDKDSEIDALNLGAVDFIPKPFDHTEVIMARINRSIELSESRIIVKASERDELTDVYNKHVFEKYVERIDKYKNDEAKDMIVINISRFHLYNELYGKEEGDKVLINLANVLKEIALKNDGIVSRLESDYFALYITHLNNYDELINLINDELKNKYNISNINIKLGIYPINDKLDNIDDRIERARLVCNDINKSNNKFYNIYDEENQKRQLFNEKLNHDFKKAIQNKEFQIYFQPKISILNGKYILDSAEALVRWIHPELGFISPFMFIPLFEENGNIKILDQYVWNETAKQIKLWQEKYNKYLNVSINVSRVDLFDSEIVDILNSIVKKNNIEAKYLHLEITESAYNNETDQITEIINKLRNLGFMIEIDDFGSGYSSLNTLATLSFDYIKLDMKFVRDMFKNDKTLKMVGIVSDIAKYLNVKLVAEGVEKKEELEKLKELKYDYIQGYYFSKPLPSIEFEKLFGKEFN